MDANLVPNLVNGALIVLVGFVLNYVLRDRIRSLEARLDVRFDSIDQRFDAMEKRIDKVGERIGRLETRVDRLEDRIESLRGDITQIALAVGARLRPQTG